MDRYERLDLILRWLAERPGLTASAISRELGVSQRSVFRDLDYLRKRGHPIEGDAGRGGGLRIHPNWGMGRLFLSNEEGLCLLLSLAVSEKIGFPMFASGIRSARKRIVAAYPAHQKKAVSKLQERIFIGEPASAAVCESYREPPPDSMSVLQRAFVAEAAIRIKYVDENRRVTRRKVEPHALFINWPAWYLLAFDHLRSAPRTFRVDRVLSAELLEGETFKPRPQAIFEGLAGQELGSALG